MCVCECVGAWEFVGVWGVWVCGCWCGCVGVRVRVKGSLTRWGLTPDLHNGVATRTASATSLFLGKDVFEPKLLETATQARGVAVRPIVRSWLNRLVATVVARNLSRTPPKAMAKSE